METGFITSVQMLMRQHRSTNGLSLVTMRLAASLPLRQTPRWSLSTTSSLAPGRLVTSSSHSSAMLQAVSPTQTTTSSTISLTQSLETVPLPRLFRTHALRSKTSLPTSALIPRSCSVDHLVSTVDATLSASTTTGVSLSIVETVEELKSKEQESTVRTQRTKTAQWVASATTASTQLV